MAWHVSAVASGLLEDFIWAVAKQLLAVWFA